MHQKVAGPRWARIPKLDGLRQAVLGRTLRGSFDGQRARMGVSMIELGDVDGWNDGLEKCCLFLQNADRRRFLFEQKAAQMTKQKWFVFWWPKGAWESERYTESMESPITSPQTSPQTSPIQSPAVAKTEHGQQGHLAVAVLGSARSRFVDLSRRQGSLTILESTSFCPNSNRFRYL